MLTHVIAKRAVHRQADALLLNLFRAAIIYKQFIFILWLLSGKTRPDLDPALTLFNQSLRLLL